MACRWGFDVLGLRVVTLMTLPGNVASERVAHKAGFVRMGMIQDYRPPKARDPEARHAVTQWVLRSSHTAG
jgi:RimJ/RimL family protein N-acetyltransferase